ncbi:MAG: carbohydrate ABC transporter substrate-binding protein [Clostridiales bacterium]|nr:carbohydrate ABC transporter substrate-binding protein [Clostridiales bacterium]
MNDKKELALCDQAGIHILEEGTSTWQTIVDGDMTSLTMKTMYMVGFVSAANSNYYILYISQNGYSFMKYSYDDSANAVPSNELNIYSIKDNPTLRQAAAVFRQTHPDIKVNFNIIITDEEYLEADQAIIDDYVRALNTELLAGNGPDILVLDDLPIDSYIAKGHLLDISDIIQPMIDKDQLYTDIMSNYNTNDKIYYLPTRIIPNLICTRSSDADKLSRMEDLSEYLEKARDRTVLGKMTYEDFINEFAPYIINKILNEDRTVSNNKLTFQLDLLKTIGDSIGLVDQYIGDEKYINSEINIANEIELAFSHPMGFSHAMIPIGMVDLVKGNYIVFENSFIPVCELAVNQASDRKELSKEFVSLVISEEVQKEDFFDGFPVNKKAMELCIQKETGDYGAAVGIRREDGSEEIHYFEPMNKDQKKELADKYAGISNRIVKNEPLLAFIKDELREFLNDSLSIEDTALRIIDRINIYLSE